MNLIKQSLFLLAGAALFTSCSEDDNDNNSNPEPASIMVKLTDAPADYDAVLIDIQQVEFTTDDGKHTANLIHPGVYNLLDYANGWDTLLVEKDIPEGRLNQIRLILGGNNTVVVDSQSYPLQTPSAQQSGLKLNVQAELIGGAEYAYTLDFDAARSIVTTGNGSYILKPVIRVFTMAVSGGIDGYVNPHDAAYYAYVVDGTDTLGTSIDSTGYYKIVSVPAGTYTVHAMATTGFTDQSLSGINVVNGNITRADTLDF